jgi:triphosphoribosyl-dephospho-CoA synthase
MSPAQSPLSERLAAAFKTACLAELEALKPGNVHIFADGHGMTVQDFLRSAEAAAQEIARDELSVGQRIFAATDATWRAVGCNTNLGIVLLAAPLMHAALHGTKQSLRARLDEILSALTVEDAAWAYRAILQASPGGLGGSARYDVRDAPQVSLLEAMREAASRDRIALQYVTGFQDVFRGAQTYRSMLNRWGSTAWAATAIYLDILADNMDTHLFRKYGEEIAQQVRIEAAHHRELLLSQENPKKYQRALLEFDRSLKGRGLNPGTSADLTVASLLVVELENMVTDFACS